MFRLGLTLKGKFVCTSITIFLSLGRICILCLSEYYEFESVISEIKLQLQHPFNVADAWCEPNCYQSTFQLQE